MESALFQVTMESVTGACASFSAEGAGGEAIAAGEAVDMAVEQLKKMAART
jgi:hypothetical protein